MTEGNGKIEVPNQEKEKIIFKDDGSMRTDYSLAYFEKVEKGLEGEIVKLEAQRGKPEICYNTKLFTNLSEEIWLSGLTCGKPDKGALGLLQLVSMIGWDKYVGIDEVQRIILMNNSFRMEFRSEIETRNKRIFVFGQKGTLWVPN